jgi:predicted lipoprotein with Yx(FWY)xxD motif
MRARRFSVIALGLSIILGLAACGGGGASGDAAGADGTATTATTAPAPAEAPAAAGDTVAVKSAETELGNILVGPNGHTLYGFTNDVDGQSSCSGTCAEAWPPLIVDEDWTVGPGLDNAVFNTVTREDGTQQLVAGRWPLYYFSGDTAPGDVNGQGSGGVWFAVNVDTTLVDAPASGGEAEGGDAGADESGQAGEYGETGDASAQTVQVAETSLGDAVVDSEGMTLYAFTQDADGTPTCTGDCASTWPALLVEGEPAIGDPLDPATFSTVDGAEGGTQLVAGEWPLYRFSGDSAPGDVNGQGSGGVWFAVAPDGTLIDAP